MGYDIGMERELVGLLCLYAIGALGAVVESVREVVKKDNPFGIVRRYFFLGVFVWGDAAILGLFWLGAVIWTVMVGEGGLFLLVISVFWIVRSMGEVQYWLNQQYSSRERNRPRDLWGSKWFGGDSIWFVYQVFWQCMTVISSVWTIYLIRDLVTC